MKKPVSFLKKLSVFFLFVLLILAAAGFYVYDQLQGPGGPQPVKIEIPKGASGREVASLLKQASVIKNELIFRLMLRLKPDVSFTSGSFSVDPGGSVFAVINALAESEPEIAMTTIPEGLTVDETAGLLESKGVCLKSDFFKAAQNGAFYVKETKLDSLEGYLFPETYHFPKEFDANKVISAMIAEFDNRFVPLYRQHKDDMPVKLSLAQVVVLASLVEREAQVASERSVIAGVYFNRLRKNMKLECDATVMYALGEKKDVLLYRDLEVDSPYNTYKYPGLPPGPIASPGMASLKAVLAPEMHNYYYYVRNDVKNDGSHVFTGTFQEHNEAIARYQR